MTHLPPAKSPREQETAELDAYTTVVLSMRRDGRSAQEIAAHMNDSVETIEQIIAAAAEAIPEIADLLSWAAAHDDADVRADGERAAAALAALRSRRQTDAELDQIATEKTELEQRLASLQAREEKLRPPQSSKKRRQTERDYEPRTVRAWARDNGHEVPDRGKIPSAVIEAWRQRPEARALAAVS
ncbi:histone-like nucleoid-structuring protein Lsr2 [Actinacidiphila glaucinigra]|uniref:Lsr2 family DNA-binding protein n=1 Tax=Actinacidiphila glaucinigra TaxID=235986 RepID=UPI003680EFC6